MQTKLSNTRKNGFQQIAVSYAVFCWCKTGDYFSFNFRLWI